ncbi:ABC transporter ATP-binding protein [Yinghuangia sp. ASG 101]|nr:ABC transporter ATP-binding protein [Yinghuangia sp. ASG 101]UGQ15307.1 ABC transporter ATP-binding protein [Yinghuangia sp. ASG 101]
MRSAEAATGASLTVASATIGYPGREVLSDLDLDIPAGRVLVVVGASGCGKSTLLRALAGLLRPASGRIVLDGEAVEAPSGDRALVFQEDGLLPWRSVRRNIELPLSVRGIPRRARKSPVAEWIGRVGLTGFENHLPRELSGGMRQRVQLARALVVRPRVLLMDEPFGALDTQTRTAMQDLLVDVWQRHRTTLVFVTHDVDEALFLGDRIAVLGPHGTGLRAVVDVPHPRERDARHSPDVLAARARILGLLTSPASAAGPSGKDRS